MGYFLSDLNEIIFFGDLIDYAVRELDLDEMRKNEEGRKNKGVEPLQEVLLINLEKNVHEEMKKKLMFIYLNSVFECYLNNIVRFLLRKHYGILGKVEIDIEKLIESPKEMILYDKIEKVARDILYGDYLEIIKNIDKKFNTDIRSLISNAELEKLDEFKTTRNRLLHMKTRILQLPTLDEFKSQVATHFEEELVIDIDYVMDFRDTIQNTAIMIDKTLCKLNPEINI